MMLMVSFWHNLWCGNMIMKYEFSSMYLLDIRREVVVAQQFQMLLCVCVWWGGSLDQDDGRLCLPA